MADKPASDRTEQPTEERLRKAREDGQLPQSQEVPSALMLAALLTATALLAWPTMQWASGQVEGTLSGLGSASISEGTLASMIESKSLAMLKVLAPFLAVAGAVSILSSLLVSGLTFCPKAMKLKLDRISPISGMKNLVSLRSLVRLLSSLAKLAVILLLIWLFLRSKRGELLALHWSSPTGIATDIARLVGQLVLRIVLALLAIAGLDWLYQRWQWKRQLRMTKQELKEERRQYEQAPEIKNRVRGVQMAMARKRMLQDVPTADVVVTNPTHFAVALKYEAGMDAPQVVAKGADFLAQKIREVARDNGVPVVEKPALARALYSTVDVGQDIPESLFVAVAEVLAMIYKVRKNHAGARPRSQSNQSLNP